MVQSVVVYRNPVEAAMWESGLVAPLMVSVLVAFIVTLTVAQASDYLAKHSFWYKEMIYRKYQGNIVAISAIVSVVATVYFMLRP